MIVRNFRHTSDPVTDDFIQVIRAALDEAVSQLGASEVHEYSDGLQASVLYTWELDTWRLRFPRLARWMDWGSNVTSADLWIIRGQSGTVSFEFEGQDERTLIKHLGLDCPDLPEEGGVPGIRTELWNRLLGEAAN